MKNKHSKNISSHYAVVVNDDPTQLSVLSELLRKAGLESRTFTGAEAALVEINSDSLPSIIVTDINMPGIDGWRFCRLLRSPEYAAFNQIPILVVSATFSGEEPHRIAADLSADAFLPSPVDGKRFIEQVQAILSGERKRIPLRVLIVEDDESLAVRFKKAFEATGYKADIALTVHAASEVFTTAVYDVAVLDYHLPDGTGKALLDEFQTERPDCVCLVMTSDPSSALALDLMKRGAAAYLRKPFDPEYLLEICARARRERALLHVQYLLDLRTRDLQESETRFREVLENSLDASYKRNLQTNEYDYLSPVFTNICGYTPDEMKTLPIDTVLGLMHPDDQSNIEQVVAESMTDSAGSVYKIEYRFKHKDGQYRWLQDKFTVVRDANGKPLSRIGSVSDITESKYEEDKYRVIFNNEIYAICIFDLETLKLLDVNEAYTSVYGYSREELISGMTIHDITAKRQVSDEATAKAKREGTIFIPLRYHRKKDGTVFPVEIVGGPYEWKGRKVMFALANDITARKKAEDIVRSSNEKLDLALKSAKMGVWQFFFAENKRIFDDQVCFLLGIDPETFGGSTGEFYAAVHPDDREMMKAALNDTINSGIPYEPEYRVIWPDGSVHHITARCDLIRDEEDGAPIMINGLIWDITERKLADEENEILKSLNRQLQKSASLDRMAGAIAHNFNNMLAVVMGNLELTIASLHDKESIENLTDAMKAAMRASEVSSQMLTYLGQTAGKRLSLDISEMCRCHLPILRVAMPTNVVLKADALSPESVIFANENQMQQVLTNLISNAWEAMGDGNGTIRLTVKPVVSAKIPTENRRPLEWQPQENDYICLEVVDMGCGIPSKDIENLFDPFFSTKFTGRGLGLSIVFGIVNTHDGVITVESKPGRGSVFSVFLPKYKEKISSQADKADSIPEMTVKGTILLVDDEEAVRKMTEKILTGMGYTVLTAIDGVDALEVFKQHKDKIHCVICDLAMPRMNGWETLAALRKLAPDIPVIFSSGYDEASVMTDEHSEKPNAFLGKPYQMKALQDAINATRGE